MPLIGREEYLTKAAPVYWLKANNPSWGQFQRDIIEKWITAHLGGWVYVSIKPSARSGESEYIYIFEKDGDRIYLSMWLKGDPFAEDYGEILPYENKGGASR